MNITPMEIRSYEMKKALRGYDAREVEALREAAADALEDAHRRISALEERLKETRDSLEGHMANERLLKEAITTAQGMAGEIKENAAKEAELIIAEARLQADEIVRQAQTRSTQLNDEIFRLRKQRREIEASVRALIDYHSSTLTMEGEESERNDEEAGKLKFLPRPE